MFKYYLHILVYNPSFSKQIDITCNINYLTGLIFLMLQLARSVNNLRIIPATLPPLNSFTTTGLSFNVAGWGRAEDDRTPRYLCTLRVNAISLRKCSQNLSIGKDRFIVVPFIYICTQTSPPAFTTCVSTPIGFSSIQLLIMFHF